MAELSSLGATKLKETVAGVYFDGSLETAYRACLWSRLANKVLMPIASSPCHQVDDIYQAAKAVDWTQHAAGAVLDLSASLLPVPVGHHHIAGVYRDRDLLGRSRRPCVF